MNKASKYFDSRKSRNFFKNSLRGYCIFCTILLQVKALLLRTAGIFRDILRHGFYGFSKY